MVSMCSEKPIRIPPCLSGFPNVAFETVPMFVWLTMALSRPFRKDRLALPLSQLSPPGDHWRDAFDFVPTGSVSSSSALQVFREASHLWGWLDPPVYLLSHSPSLHVQVVHPQEFSKMDVDHWHIPVWASYSTFHFFFRTCYQSTYVS